MAKGRCVSDAKKNAWSVSAAYAALVLLSAGVFVGGYLLGRSDLGIDRPTPAAASALGRAASGAEATLTPIGGPTEDAGTSDTIPEGDAPPRLSPVMSPIVTPMQKGYDLTPYIGQVILRAPYKTKKIALTFDDGPSKYTLDILRVLKERRVTATFFFIGRRIVGCESAARAAVEQGCQVANHTYSHAELSGLSPQMVESEIKWGQTEIERVTGVHNGIVRPHGGVYDATALAVIKKMRLVLVNWDAYGEDTFSARTTAAQIERFAVIESSAGSILLLHETNPASLKALPGIITRLRAKGYEFVTVDEMLGQRQKAGPSKR
jgi:peptidoglycan/xylan/chitin deacetylase (PgdA/CDA1 family)